MANRFDQMCWTQTIQFTMHVDVGCSTAKLQNTHSEEFGCSVGFCISCILVLTCTTDINPLSQSTDDFYANCKKVKQKRIRGIFWPV